MNKNLALGFVILVIVGIPAYIWGIMLLFGAVHTFFPVIPAFGFWQTTIIVILIDLLFPSMRGAKK